MSPKNRLLAVGLSALGLALPATRVVADEPTAPASPTPAAAPSPAEAPTVLLLSNGRTINGSVVQDDGGYVVRHEIGEVRFKRREVEGAFPSLKAAFEHKLARTPERDPSERLKLARWCLDQSLNAEAKQVLEGLVRLDPDDREAKAMLYNLTVSLDRAKLLDAEVARAGAEVETGGGPDEPRALDLSGVRGRKVGGVPVIFDLPSALAIRRSQEFARAVHGELQRRCIGCHNESTPDTAFRLLRARTRRDASNEVLLRHNLDAVVALVNPDDLSDSPILNLAFKPHGPKRNPLFTGPNDTAYRVLANWVMSLEAPASAPKSEPTRAVGFAPEGPAPPAEGFATARTKSRPKAKSPTKPKAAGDLEAEEELIGPGKDADYNTLSPLYGGPNAAKVKSKPSPRPAGFDQKLKPLVDKAGNPVLDEDGQPIFEAPQPAKDGKAKDFEIKADSLRGLLNRRK